MAAFTFRPGMVIVLRAPRNTENVIRVLEVSEDILGQTVRYEYTSGRTGRTSVYTDHARDIIPQFSDSLDEQNLNNILCIQEASE